VRTWPGVFETTRALSVGFVGDADVDTVIREFMDESGYDPIRPDPTR
jgi:hypothetical protein